MRRWLALLLLVTLPFQWTWAAAAGYCAHEASPGAAKHVGHHEHDHKAGAEAGKSKAASQGNSQIAKLLGESDCGYCQLSAAKPLQPQITWAVVPMVAPPLRAFAAVQMQTRHPDRLERPNWCVFA